MAEFESCVVPFPFQRRPLHECERFPLPSDAAAELRGVMLGNLLDQVAEPDGLQPADLRVRIAAYSALALLDEMVVLYRRALSEVRGGAPRSNAKHQPGHGSSTVERAEGRP
ncbi:conserved protein of unknown function [Ectopseudomonas oleovorans]|uniref:Uncharacterized protein n=1 Tax=Ectopseudomonas oleovorans TaxID=301 RepID=A0A653AXW9_ECTOL|nr:hypothetical protein [Pseudomonas indoloxydans]CAE6934520.1 conserved protein of unknown function [Pseudomonas oleovorans]